MEKIIQELNEMLIADTFDKAQFESLIQALQKQFNLKLILGDFEFYNEKRLENTQKEKRTGIESLNIDWALLHRNIEKWCKEKLELKDQYKIERSKFYQEEDVLFYFHMGASKNDKKAKEFFYDLSLSIHDPDFPLFSRQKKNLPFV